MGEVEALKAIAKGSVTIPCTDNHWLTERIGFKVVKEPTGGCSECYFNEHPTYHTCPSLARKICCTGGYILKEKFELLDSIDLSGKYLQTYKSDDAIVYYKVLSEGADVRYYNAIRVSSYSENKPTGSKEQSYTISCNEDYLGYIEDYVEISKEEFMSLFNKALEKINNIVA